LGECEERAPRAGACLTAIADGNDIERTKPAPDVFLVAAERLGVEPAECLVVEDAEAGIRAAKAAGMVAAAIGNATRSAEADYRLTGIGDVVFTFGQRRVRV
jgi:beta-phosphoglucomutase